MGEWDAVGERLAGTGRCQSDHIPIGDHGSDDPLLDRRRRREPQTLDAEPDHRRDRHLVEGLHDPDDRNDPVDLGRRVLGWCFLLLGRRFWF